MAEAVVAFEVVETALQGAAIGGLAVSKATVPLHVHFKKIPSPSPSLARSSHSLTVVKGKAYIFGGDVTDGRSGSEMQVLTLPSDLALQNTDYQRVEAEVEPERPLAPFSTHTDTADEGFEGRSGTDQKNVVPQARSAHAATAIDSNIYVFGGRQSSATSETPLDENGVVHAFSTLTRKWKTLRPHATRCSSGVPPPRTHAGLTSTPHPLPTDRVNVSTEDHGTLFLHGGYGADGRLLRDVWVFDVSSRVWLPWPDVPRPGPEDTEGEGRICCVESKLWRMGDGFGKVQYLEILRDDADDGSGRSELGVSPKTGRWEVLSFGETAEDEVQDGKGPTARADDLPVPRKDAGFVPVTTGAGREYLLYFMGEDAPGSVMPDIWSFQIESDKKSAALVKDKIRRAAGKETGENQWARCEVVETTKEDGVLERPQGLSGFAADTWTDRGGGTVVVWGGRTAEREVRNEGWVMTVE